jgi:Ala-tRNA(Pro) deacylase
MSEAVLRAIREHLAGSGVAFEEFEHREVRTAEEAAAVRGWPLDRGAKSILFKVDGAFGIYVMSGGRAMHSRLVRRHLGASRTRFANAEELAALTGVLPGAVPPFGRPIFDLPLYADPSLFEQERIGFTAGVRTVSILLRSEDWRRAAAPEVFPFSR